MSKTKVSNTAGHTKLSRASRYKSISEKKLKVVRFMGVSLSGGKNDKTCVTIVDYYPQHHKIFLKEIHDKIMKSFKPEVKVEEKIVERVVEKIVYWDWEVPAPKDDLEK